VIADYVTAGINKRADLEARKPKPRQAQLVSTEELSQIDAFAITPEGLMIYFDFPHVMSVFDKKFIPYSVVSELLQRPLKRQ
jgi:hypothetical protein